MTTIPGLFLPFQINHRSEQDSSYRQEHRSNEIQASMEGVSTSVYKGLRGYWRSRGYVKLSGSGRHHKNWMEPRKRRVWRIKLAPKVKLSFLRRIPSPNKFLVWLRDAYVNLMLGFANSRVFTTTYGGSICHDGTGSFGKRPLKEYDDKMIVEIYKSLMLTQGQLVPRDAPKLGSEIVYRQ
ncbi:uncharacterized protein LOC126795005 [Argentina anserina]|uniref:uncharacterized protein LOC126795005 n=1 Tax=Argentina anserina TaxID=57926 RepID=UPI0021767E09|nr:uncharacterized protein LOC126795005 [Potentilla anserina]